MKTDFVSIDRDRLDEEWLTQAEQFLVQAINAAEARKSMDEAREAADVVWAEIYKQVKESPEKFGYSKVTEELAKSIAETQPEVRAAVQLHIDRKFELGIAEAVVEAFQHRKRALENLVTLQAQGYYMSGAASREDVDAQRKSVRDRTGLKRDILKQEQEN